MKTNTQLLKQLQELTKGLTKVKPKKQLSTKQLEALKNGRNKLSMKRSQTVTNSSIKDKIVNTLHFSSWLAYLLSYFSFMKSLVYKLIAFILIRLLL
jgi:hypothetical protein